MQATEATSTVLFAAGALVTAVGAGLLLCPSTTLRGLQEKRRFVPAGLTLARICGVYVVFTGATACYCAHNEIAVRSAAVALALANAAELGVKVLYQPPSLQWAAHVAMVASLAGALIFDAR